MLLCQVADFPLHAALKAGRGLKECQEFLQRDPACAKKSDSAGMLPLHVAAAEKAALEVMRLIVDQHPEAKTIRDKQGCFPLHHAKQSGAEGNILDLLRDPTIDEVIRFFKCPFKLCPVCMLQYSL